MVAAARHGSQKPLPRASLPDDAIRHALLRAIDDIPEVVHVALVERISDQEIRERWGRELTEPELVRMAYVLEPRLHHVLMDAAELLFSAWLRAAPAGRTWQPPRSAFWSFVFGFLADTRTSGRSLERLIAHFFDVFGPGLHDAPPVRAESEAAIGPSEETTGRKIDRLVDAAIERATLVGNAAVPAILDRDRAALMAPRAATSAQSPDDSDEPVLRSRKAVSPNQAHRRRPGAAAWRSACLLMEETRLPPAPSRSTSPTPDSC